MRAGRVILIVLLLLPGGCQRKPRERAVSLHDAVWQVDLAQMRSLFAHGANVDEKDGYGRTPLHVAAKMGQARAVTLLITYGAGIDANDGHFGTPLHYAAWEGHAAVVRKLVAAGADVNLRSFQFNSTPLQLALSRYHIDVTEFLLAGGANPNTRDEWDRTVLHDAAFKGLVNFAELLLAHGAQVNAKDTEGLTPLHEAACGGNLEMAQVLLTHGADANATDIDGQTPLHVAAINGHREFFDLLVKEGADVHLRDELGRTALGYGQGPAPAWIVPLHADGQSPYSVILTNPSAVREFLRRQSILYDRVWISGKEDIDALDLKDAIGKSTQIKTKTQFDLDYILSHLSGYNREYAGFIRQGRKYLFCNMDFSQFNREPQEGFTWGSDGGCNLARVVIDIADKAVVRIDCNGN